MEFLCVGAFAWCCFIALGWFVANEKNRDGPEGAVLALFFGPFGVLIEAMLPTQTIPRIHHGIENVNNDALYKNPAYDQWKDLIDWAGVETEEDELKAKRIAYTKYLKVAGPKPKRCFYLKTNIQWTCPCNVLNFSPLDRASTVVACSFCNCHLVLPDAPKPPPPPPAPPPLPRAEVIHGFDDEAFKRFSANPAQKPPKPE